MKITSSRKFLFLGADENLAKKLAGMGWKAFLYPLSKTNS